MYERLSIPILSFGTTKEPREYASSLYWPNSVCIEKDKGNIMLADNGHDRIIFFSKDEV